MKVLLPHKIKSEEFSLYRSSRGTQTKLCDVFPVLISAVPASFLPWKSQRFRTAHQKGLKGEIEFLWNFKALKLLLENFVQNSQPDYFQSKIVSIDFPTSFRLPIPRRDFRIHFISFFFFFHFFIRNWKMPKRPEYVIKPRLNNWTSSMYSAFIRKKRSW